MSLVPRKSLVLLELKSKRKLVGETTDSRGNRQSSIVVLILNGHKNFRKLNGIDVAFYIGGRKNRLFNTWAN